MARLIGNIDATGSLSTSVSTPATNANAVSLYLPFDTNVNDASANGHSVTSVGSAGLSSTQAKFGANSLSLNGSSQYLTVADNDAFNFQAENFTVEVFVYPTTLQQSGIYSQWGSGSNRSFKITMTSSGAIAVNGSRNGSTGNHLAITSSENLTVNSWHHIAAVCSNSTVTLYINGKISGSGGIGGSLYNSTNNIAIGANIAGVASNLFAGFIDDLRVTKGIALYSQNFVPPSQAVGASLTGTNETNSGSNLTSLYLPLNSDVNDDSSNNHTITALGGAVISSAQSKFGGSSVYLDGGVNNANGSRLRVSSDVYDQFYLSDFTMEMFIYPTTLKAARLWSQWEGTRPLLLQIQSNGNLQVLTNNTSRLVTSGGVTANSWFHIAFVRIGETFTLFIDGVNKGRFEMTGNLNSYSDDAYIGARYSGAAGFEGYIDDFRIVRSGIYTDNFTPPTSALTASISQTRNDLAVLYLPFDSGLADEARNHLVTANGNAAVSATQAKFGAQSLTLDGSGDYLSISRVPALSQNPFTIQAFVYPAVVNTYQTLFDSRVNNSTNGGMTVQITNAAKIQVYAVTSSGTVNFTTSASISANSWQHIALVRSGTGSNETQIFIDGVSAGTLTLAGNLSLSSFNIGKTFDNYYLNGFIDDYRITTFAEYSANFTPPTAALSSEVLGTTTDTRTFSSVWNLNSPEVTEAFKAGTWPS